MQDHYLNLSLKELEEMTRRLARAESIQAQDMVEASAKAHLLIQKINDLSIIEQNQDVHNLFNQMLLLLSQLNQISQAEDAKAPPPHEMMSALTSSFEAFLNSSISKDHQEKVRSLASNVPMLDSVIYCCETMPYFWHHANRAEKVAMVLGTTLILAASALMIATPLAPALAALEFMPALIMGCFKLGKTLYNAVISNPKKKYEDKQTLDKVKTNLEYQEKFVNDRINTLYPKSNRLLAAANAAITRRLRKRAEEKLNKKSAVIPSTYAELSVHSQQLSKSSATEGWKAAKW